MEMKKRIKKIGVLAVLLLASVVIFAPKEAEGQKQIDISDPPNGNKRHWVEIKLPGSGITLYGCVNGGNECLDDIVVS
jgi:hypothetical protein